VWESGEDVSPVGRTRTAPDPTSSRPLNIGFSSCQSYPHGFYGAHAHAAAQDLDLYVFLGDYIYAEDRIPTEGDVREDLFNANDLRSYRRKYRLYRSDAGLRELHRVHPAMHIWDDHEVENNYTDNRPAPSPLQRTAAYRAAFEWVPHAVYRQDRFRIYKKMSFGRTADVFFLDDRQYRTVDENDRPVLMLGEQQMQWLIAGLQASQATWKVIAQQVVVAPMNFGNGPSTDSWGGFDNSRTRLLSAIERAGIPNVVFLTGDAHVFECNHLASDFTALGEGRAAPSAVEYVGGSVTSPGSDRSEATARATNPWTKQYNGMQHGYAHMALDGSNLVTEYRRTDLSRPDGATTTFERFTQPAGANAIQRESFPV
jgi:phosphodiesterase/alkaline phosphatase D-like protein